MHIRYCARFALWGATLMMLGGAAAGCADNDGPIPVSFDRVTRFDLLGAGSGSTLHNELCQAAGLGTGCDLCEVEGYYEDEVCDAALIANGLCAGPDPDCEPAAADLYVAPDGDDGNPGTEADPLATVTRALELVEPGELVYLRGGTYRPTEITSFRNEATPEAPIVIRAYPGEQVVIDGSDVPEGDVNGGSSPTWYFHGAKHLRILGPIHLTNGRGAGVLIEEDTHSIDLVMIESSYNGQTASRAGHGFLIVEEQWADARDVRFIDCDAHHNANHRARDGEDVAENQYQHGDGFRIKSGQGVELIGCRAWYNLDDGYDLVWAAHPILLKDCWAAHAGMDDPQGTITGTPGYAAEWGEGIKLGYDSDAGRHRCIRCLSFQNVHLGFRMDGGPNELLHCASFGNGRRALGWDLGSERHVIRNSLDFDTYRESDIPASTSSESNTWDEATGVTVTIDDFLSVDAAGLLGPRGVDGSLPVTDFLRLAPGSDLIDAGVDVGMLYSGAAPDLGCFERP